MIEPYLAAFKLYYKIGRVVQLSVLHQGTTIAANIELCDQVDNGICLENQGDLVISNKDLVNIVIINFEKFIDFFGSATIAGRGKKCDFLVYKNTPADKHLVFVELTNCKEHSLSHPPAGGQEKTGKRSKAWEQLKQSIEKIMVVPEIAAQIESFSGKSGLFAFRLKNEPDDFSPVEQATNHFNRFTEEVPSLMTPGSLPYGFNFHQRKYPEPFNI